MDSYWCLYECVRQLRPEVEGDFNCTLTEARKLGI